jgi:hypothetical protein
MRNYDCLTCFLSHETDERCDPQDETQYGQRCIPVSFLEEVPGEASSNYERNGQEDRELLLHTILSQISGRPS